MNGKFHAYVGFKNTDAQWARSGILIFGWNNGLYSSITRASSRETPRTDHDGKPAGGESVCGSDTKYSLGVCVNGQLKGVDRICGVGPMEFDNPVC